MKVDKTKWEKKTLGQIGKIISGSTPRTDNPLNWEGGIHNWVTPAELKGEKFYGSTQKKITDYALSTTKLILMPVGTVLLSSRAPIGKVAITTEPMYCNQGFKNIECNSSIHNEYLYYYLKYNNDELNRRGNGVTFKEISKKIVEQFPVIIPSLNEQQAIASELDAIQTMIDCYKAQLADLDALAQSIFLDMFGDPVANPKGWKKESLNKYASIGTGATPSRKILSYYEGDIPWVKSTEVHNSYILETQEHITQEAIDNSNCSIYLPNTILIAMYGQGKTRGQVGLLKIEATTNQACAAIRCKDSLDPIFCYWHFQMCYEANRELGNGTNQKNMNLTIVGNIKFIIPPLVLQQLFAHRVEAIEQQKELIKSQLADAEFLIAERMQYYFS